ncbi:MAG: ankyrin repeat domain-containing protein [Rickettsiales bacterium]|nr:ankyrin repeat domain-containing protein [Rickettsiales bacterium]
MLFANVLSANEVTDLNSLLSITSSNKDFNLTSIMNSALQNNPRATRVFIMSGENPNEINIAGATALHIAARSGSLEVADILIKNNAQINLQDKDGWTPLMRAALKNNVEIVKLLLDNGANPLIINEAGNSALVYAAMSESFDITNMLLKYYSCGSFLSKYQISKAIVIVVKKYNEPLIKLLKDKQTKCENTIEEARDRNMYEFVLKQENGNEDSNDEVYKTAATPRDNVPSTNNGEIQKVSNSIREEIKKQETILKYILVKKGKIGAEVEPLREPEPLQLQPAEKEKKPIVKTQQKFSLKREGNLGREIKPQPQTVKTVTKKKRQGRNQQKHNNRNFL